MATRDEQETTVTFNRADNTVRIGTAHPPHVRTLRKDNRAPELEGSPADQTEDIWGSFTVPASDFDPLTGFKRRMSEEQRQANADRLARLRAERPQN